MHQLGAGAVAGRVAVPEGEADHPREVLGRYHAPPRQLPDRELR
ncbi:hypothetical protein P9869_06525 [Streptomyces ossamyceticus]|nr:hypothetical protein [Streptomyces ossamyceticus]